MQSFFLRVFDFVLRFSPYVALQNGFLRPSVFMREECFVQAVRASPANGRPVDNYFFAAHLFTYSGIFSASLPEIVEKGIASLTVIVQNRGWYCARVRVPDALLFCFYALCLSTQTFQHTL